MHLGLIGFGNIGLALLDLLDKTPVDRVTALVRPGRESAAQAGYAARLAKGASKGAGANAPPVDITSDLDTLLQTDLVVECAGHAAVADFGPALLGAGKDLVIVSVGALADPELQAKLTKAQGSSTGRMIFPIGAIGGIDLLSTLGQAGTPEVTYRGIKPPAAWKGSAAEAVVDLDNLTTAAQFFSGSARDAARQYPKNANVVAALALAGAGFDATRVELVADPAASGNTHTYRVSSPLCQYDMQIAAQPSADNPRTSATTAWSILTEVRRYAEQRLGG